MERLVEREQDGTHFLHGNAELHKKKRGEKVGWAVLEREFWILQALQECTKPVDGEERAWGFSIRTSERDESKDSNPLKFLLGSWTGPLNIEMRPQEICLYLGYTINVET